MGKKLTNKDVKKRIREIHNDLYDLSRVEYVNRRTKVELICSKHGSWLTYTEQLFRGQGCPKCGKKIAGKKRRLTFNDFVKRANEIHSIEYEYYKEGYVKSSSKLKIKCPIHGIFIQGAGEHLYSKQGCPKCGNIVNSNKRKLPLNEFISRSNEVHNNFYDYSLVDYVRSSTKVKIKCPTHGYFMQEPQNHLNGSRCPKCSLAEQVKRQTKPREVFIEQSILIHGETYDYSLIDYVRSSLNVKIVCEKHGMFLQTPNSHLTGSGCPNCNISRGEELVKLILKSHNIKFKQQKTFDGLKDVRNLKCDFYLKDYNTVIEFNGRQHYEPVMAFGGEQSFLETLRRDNIKREYLKKNNIKLLEVHYKNDDVETLILNFLK
jgi:ssDNA-binding Zn-finger/Zn-ribbon topoisomerase 1